MEKNICICLVHKRYVSGHARALSNLCIYICMHMDISTYIYIYIYIHIYILRNINKEIYLNLYVLGVHHHHLTLTDAVTTSDAWGQYLFGSGLIHSHDLSCFSPSHNLSTTTNMFGHCGLCRQLGLKISHNSTIEPHSWLHFCWSRRCCNLHSFTQKIWWRYHAPCHCKGYSQDWKQRWIVRGVGWQLRDGEDKECEHQPTRQSSRARACSKRSGKKDCRHSPAWGTLS